MSVDHIVLWTRVYFKNMTVSSALAYNAYWIYNMSAEGSRIREEEGYNSHSG